MALNHSTDTPLADQLAAVMGWWRDAGVDCDFVDEPQAMLAVPEVAVSSPVRAKPVVAKVEEAPMAPLFSAEGLPADLAGFCAYWCDPASPLPCPPTPRLAPRGVVGAKVMLLALMPEADDQMELFSGPQGRMLGNMLAALGINQDDALFATALPAYMAMPDWDGLAASGYGAVLGHLIALARPERVLLLGNPLAPLLGDMPMPLLSALAPDQLLAHPRQRARMWARLLDWMPA